MRRFCRLAAVVLAAATLTFGCSQTTQTQSQPYAELSEYALASNLGFDIVKSLTVEVGPRIPGSDGDKRAVEWAQAKFAELGFDRVFTQPVRVRNWSRGLADAKVTAPYEHDLVITALGGSIATPEDGLQAEIIMADSLEHLTTMSPDDVRGKIVFINHRMERDRAGRGYGPVVSGRVRGAVEASKLGASAILIRSVGTANSRFAHTGIMRYADDVEKIPAGALSNADADTIAAMVEAGHKVKLDVHLRAKELGWQTSYNVIGEFTGTERPDEIVLISAHLDSWDEGTGALDDGAGVGIVMAAAKLIKEQLGQPKRTIRVVLYAAEEIGLVGAHEYTRLEKDNLGKLIVAAESDFGAGKIYRLDTLFSPVGLTQAEPLFTALAPLGVERGNNEATGGPDVSMLPKYGVPVVNLRQDGTYYFDYHHTPNDTLDKIDPAALQQNVAVWAIFTAFMANSSIETRSPQS
ncbi:M20/M25/M40 family metallo-hydrolase [Alteromonas sp. ASW11-36]|uniref:Carboxypeptidase Q n=1 Tax=Alteromonas arenosi TaxID=3055817 RepID=A0ABT7SU64_9ALTE|nr:M20/M25/M40 family metallo-hydrolase [Alteromonas sp. ASW11-36]MDM7859732.1 M20/M25/M40 family metallo-hydrolase [Alteromonas sp. ASW11-36]